MNIVDRHDFGQGVSDTAQVARAMPLIYVVSDDRILVSRLRKIFLNNRYDVQVFLDCSKFIDSISVDFVNLLIFDVDISDTNSLYIQQRLKESGIDVPIIFIARNIDVPTSVKAMKWGALDIVIKPPNDAYLETALREAVLLSIERRRLRATRLTVRTLAAALSPREREVMNAVVEGMLNKQIAFALGIAEITVKLHRRMVMRKMQASSVIDLIRKVELIGDHQSVET